MAFCGFLLAMWESAHSNSKFKLHHYLTSLIQPIKRWSEFCLNFLMFHDDWLS